MSTLGTPCSRASSGRAGALGRSVRAAAWASLRTRNPANPPQLSESVTGRAGRRSLLARCDLRRFRRRNRRRSRCSLPRAGWPVRRSASCWVLRCLHRWVWRARPSALASLAVAVFITGGAVVGSGVSGSEGQTGSRRRAAERLKHCLPEVLDPNLQRREILTVSNLVTSGPTKMAEDPDPVKLTTRAGPYCAGSCIPGTARVTGETYDAAICQRRGSRA